MFREKEENFKGKRRPSLNSFYNTTGKESDLSPYQIQSTIPPRQELLRPDRFTSRTSIQTKISSFFREEQPPSTTSQNSDHPIKKRKVEAAYSSQFRSDNRLKSSGTLISTEDVIDGDFREVFPFPSFNRMQSECLEALLKSSQNIVVTAPTGSGKTVLFELAIIRAIKEEKQALYLAPLKALCKERAQDWKTKFQSLSSSNRSGFKLLEITGDSSDVTVAEILRANLIISTPEKWDSVTRKSSVKDHIALVKSVSLVLIDEIQSLNDQRGATLEAVISRIKSLRQRIEGDTSTVRFVGVSATCPNPQDIASWLGADLSFGCFCFDETYRPVKLETHVIGFPSSKNSFLFNRNLKFRVAEIVREYSSRRPSLVFCGTRKDTSSVAQQIVIDLENQGYSLHESREQQNSLNQLAFRLKEKSLGPLVRLGVGYYHAGMSAEDRNQIQQVFSQGLLRILCTTSSLSQGVNFPAHLVVIVGTEFYRGAKYEEISVSDILQMIGRAGRPQFDSSGKAVILTKNEMKYRYENLISGQEVIESCLLQNLHTNLNSEIVLGTITDMNSAMFWLKSTYLYQRATKSPEKYGIISGLTKSVIEQQLLRTFLSLLFFYPLFP